MKGIRKDRRTSECIGSEAEQTGRGGGGGDEGCDDRTGEGKQRALAGSSVLGEASFSSKNDKQTEGVWSASRNNTVRSSKIESHAESLLSA